MKRVVVATGLAVGCGGGTAPAATGPHHEGGASPPAAAWLEQLVFSSTTTVPGRHTDDDGLGCAGWQLGSFANDHAYMMSMGQGGTTVESACEPATGDTWRCQTVLVAPPCPPAVDGCVGMRLSISYVLDASREIEPTSITCSGAP